MNLGSLKMVQSAAFVPYVPYVLYRTVHNIHDNTDLNLACKCSPTDAISVIRAKHVSK
jgi:hypothetical protein